jgi:hypothetical protein
MNFAAVSRIVTVVTVKVLETNAAPGGRRVLQLFFDLSV